MKVNRHNLQEIAGYLTLVNTLENTTLTSMLLCSFFSTSQDIWDFLMDSKKFEFDDFMSLILSSILDHNSHHQFHNPVTTQDTQLDH
jgi:hypothetical protein